MVALHLGGEIHLASCGGEAVRMYWQEPQRAVMSRKLRKSSIKERGERERERERLLVSVLKKVTM